MNYNELAAYFVDAPVHFQQMFIYQIQSTKSLNELPYICESTGLIIPIEGKVTLAVDGTLYNLEPGVVLHVGKGMEVIKKTLTKEPVQVACVYFQHQQSAKLMKEQFKVDIANAKELTQTIQQLKQYHEQPSILAALKCQVIFYTFLEQLIQGMRECTETDYSIEEILTYIHKHYQQPLSVTEIADHFAIERRHLAYIFKRHTGMSPINYLTEYRIRLAKELLRRQEYPIMRVAELVGFEDNLYFSRIFKKRTGYSPSVYRESFMKVRI